VFRFEISDRAWSSVLASQLNFVRVEDVTAQTDCRKRMVAQWRKTSWPNERSVFCRLVIESRYVPQFHRAFSRAKFDAARVEAPAAETAEQ
jgi:hypothetical protein